METDGDDLKAQRRLLDAGVRVLEGGAGDPEFDDEFAGPEKWDRDVRDERKRVLESLACVATGAFLTLNNPGGWKFWLVLSFTVIFALLLPWRLFGWRVAISNRRRWRLERGLT